MRGIIRDSYEIEDGMVSTEARTQKWFKFFIIGVLLVIAAFLMVDFWPLGVDFYYSFYPVTHEWWRGDFNLYDIHEDAVFFNTPWMLVLLAPFTFLSIEAAQSALNLLSLLCILGSIHLYKDDEKLPIYVIIFPVLTLFVFDLLIRGQIDAFILLGIAISWWGTRHQKPYILSSGLWLMSMKPVNVLLAGLVFLIHIRKWPRRDQLKAISLPTISFAIACIVLGPEWPLRYIRYSQENPPADHISAEIWKGLKLLGLPNLPFIVLGIVAVLGLIALTFKLGLTRWTLSIALTTNFVFTTYAQDNHYVLLIPAYIFVTLADWRMGLLIYPLAWTPVLRGIWGDEASALDVLYAIALFLSSWLLGWQAYNHRLKAEAIPSYTTPVLK